MPFSPVKALRTHQLLDFIRAEISFTVTRGAFRYPRSLRNAVVVGGRLKAPPRWRLAQSGCGRLQDGGCPSQGVDASRMAAVPVRKPSGRFVLRETKLRQN